MGDDDESADARRERQRLRIGYAEEIAKLVSCTALLLEMRDQLNAIRGGVGGSEHAAREVDGHCVRALHKLEYVEGALDDALTALGWDWNAQDDDEET